MKSSDDKDTSSLPLLRLTDMTPSEITTAPAATRASNADLWVNKWKPKASSDLVGNTVLINTVRAFLTMWEDVHIRGMAPGQVPGGGSKNRDMTLKSVLLSGSPGIGKTSCATIIARECGFETVEVNASDARGKSDANVQKGIGGKLSNMIAELVTNRTMGGRKTCVIMDEVDGMSAGDRGGIQNLISLIKKSKIPIICICNDKYNQKLKTLRSYTIELDFRKPTADQIAKRLTMICNKEGLRTNDAALKKLVDMSNGDIRMILGQLQMIRLRHSTFTYNDLVKNNTFSKDSDLSPFLAADQLLGVQGDSSLSLSQRMDLVFSDMDLIPLLIQENYLNHRPNIAGSEMQRLMVIAKAAEAISLGDLINTKIRRYQEWNLMPISAAVGNVYPCTYVRGTRETFTPHEMNFTRFTSWMGQNSSQGKQKRYLLDLHSRMMASENFSAARHSLRLEYLPVLRNLVKPMADAGSDGIETVLHDMRDYCLLRDDLENILSITKFKTKEKWAVDPLSKVDGKTKAALTRTINKQGGRVKINTMVEDAKRSKGKKRVKEEMELPITEDADVIAAAMEVDEEEEEAKVDIEALKRSGITLQPAAVPVKGKAKKNASGRKKK
jgi:replication factor C subunit 1